jgi:glycosyltransferase involved in cell wall biosynthesis
LENPTSNLRASIGLIRSPWNSSSGKKISSLAREFRPDIVHVHNTWFSISPAVFYYLKKAEYPTILTLHNYRLLCSNGIFFRDGHICEDCITAKSNLPAIRHACYRSSYISSTLAAATISFHSALQTYERHVDCITVFDAFMKEKILRAGISPDRVALVPNHTATVNTQQSVSYRSKRYLYVGRLSEEKGLDVLIKAWNGSKRLRAEFELVVLGEGPRRVAFEKQAPSNVQFVGRVAADKIGEIMATSRALLFPSRWYEGQPMAIIEAMSAGLPAVVSSHGGLADLVRGSGWAVPSDSSDDWAEALVNFTDSDLQNRGEASLKKWETNHSPQVALRALEDAYSSVQR